MKPKYKVSVIIPIFNEAKSLRPLVERLKPVLNSLGSHEVIFINDGSTDDTERILKDLNKGRQDSIKSIHLRINCGKSYALQLGFREALGELVIMMDGDLQDKPEEIPKLIKHLRENDLDAVTGWKFIRHDPISKTLPSRLFNLAVSWFSGLNIHDFNCGLKVIRRESLEDLKLYGQLHRFLLVLLANFGHKVGEVKIDHSPRQHGLSKYGVWRIFQGLMDFLTVLFLTRYLQSPLYFFGFYGVCLFLISFLYGGYFIGMHIYSLYTYFPQGNLTEHPIWILSPVMLLAGLIFIFFGLIGELICHHYSTQSNKGYIKNKLGFEDIEQSMESSAERHSEAINR